MGRLLGGALIVLFVLVSGFLVAFIREGSETTSEVGFTCAAGNATACNEENEENFRDQLGNANPADLGEGTPVVLTTVWALVIVFLLSVGLALIVLAFVPLTGE